MSFCEIILINYYPDLGSIGQLIKVPFGYANYLVAQKFACFATKKNIEHYESRKSEMDLLNQKKIDHYKELANGIEGKTITIKYNAMADGKLFGSVSSADVVRELHAIGCKEVKANDILFGSIIRLIGKYSIKIRFNREIFANINIVVQAL